MEIITNYTSFRTPTVAKRLIILENLLDIQQLTLTSKDEFIVLGEGCNVLFTNQKYNGTVIINRFEDLLINELDDCAYVTAGAGMNWHLFVCQMSDSGFYGLENLAYIPGTVGASPVQNIGAYGVEACEFIDEVITYDMDLNLFVKFTNAECKFGYRNSIFKQKAFKKYIVMSVTFKLPKQFDPVLSYAGLADNSKTITANSLIKKVVDIRQSKLPNHLEIPNAGSFFKNPIIEKDLFTKLSEQNPNMPFYKLENDKFKIPAAWLIEAVGYKDKTIDGVGTYHKHSLILINKNGQTGDKIYNFAKQIVKVVETKFNIQLEPEVVIC